jgi:hypothetical protein
VGTSSESDTGNVLDKCTQVIISPATDQTVFVGESVAFNAVCKVGTELVVVTSTITWSSSNESVATVTQGNATGVTAGTAVITATANATASASVNLAVIENNVTDIVITPATASIIAMDATQAFAAQCKFADNTQGDCPSAVTWASSNDAIATIAADGTASPVTNGEVSITASIGSVTSSVPAVLTVDVGRVCDELKINTVNGNNSIAVGETIQFTAVCVEGTEETVVTDDVTWAAAGSFATINTDGLATGAAAGVETITASITNADNTTTTSADFALTVGDAVVTSVEISPASLIVPMGQSLSFTATAFMSDGTQQDVTATAGWTVADETIATVAAGAVTPVAVGNTTVTAAFGGQTSANATIIVNNAVLDSIKIEPATAAVPVGLTVTYKAIGVYTDGTELDITSGTTWSIEDGSTNIATISGNVATAVSAGSVNVKAAFGGKEAVSALTVTNATLQSIAITGDTSVANGLDGTLVVTGTYSDSTTNIITDKVAFTSDPSGIISAVSSSGVYTAQAVGTTTVTAELDGITGEVDITVTNATLVSITIAPQTQGALDNPLVLGSVVPLKAIGKDSAGDTQDLTTQVTWAANNDKVAVSNTSGHNGELTALIPGSSVVTASLGAITSTNSLNVTVQSEIGTLAYIKMNPKGWKMAEGNTYEVALSVCDQNDQCREVEPSDGLTWSVKDKDGNEVPNVTFTTSSIGSASTIYDSYGAESTWNLPGHKAIVTARIDTITASADVQVWDADIAGVVVNCKEPRTCLPANASPAFPFDCDATVTMSDGSSYVIDGHNGDGTGNWSDDEDIPGKVIWKTTHADIAELNGNQGKGTVKDPGTAVISACYQIPEHGKEVCSPTEAGEGVDVSLATLQVADMTMSDMSVTPSTQTVHMGQSAQYNAIATYTGTGDCAGTHDYDVTTIATWAVGAGTGDATSNGDGKFTGDDAGNVTVTANMGNANGAAILVIQSGCIESVEVSTANNHQVNGKEVVPSFVDEQLKVLVNYSDGSSDTVEAGSMGSWNNSAVNADSWVITVGDTDPGVVTFTVNSNTCSGNAVSDSINMVVDKNLLPDSIKLYSVDDDGDDSTDVTIDLIPGSHVNYAVEATYGSHKYWVSHQSSWLNVPAVANLSDAPATVDSGAIAVNRYSLNGKADKDSTVVTATYKNHTTDPEGVITFLKASISSVVITGTTPAIDNATGYPAGLPITFNIKKTYSDGTTSTEVDDCTFEEVTGTDILENFKDADTFSTINKSGTTNVKVTCTGPNSSEATSANYPVVINTAVLTGMLFNPDDPITQPKNTTFDLAVTGVYSNGQQFDISKEVDYQSLTAKSDDDTIAEAVVGHLGTKVKTYDSGSAKITFTKDGINVDYEVTVKDAGCIKSLQIVPATRAPAPDVTIAKGLTQDFIAKASWTAGPETIVTVDANGTWSPDNTYLDYLGITSGDAARYKALTPGDTTITFTLSDPAKVCAGGDPTKTTVSKTISVKVKDHTLTGFKWIPQSTGGQSDVFIPLGQTKFFTLHEVYSDGVVNLDEDWLSKQGNNNKWFVDNDNNLVSTDMSVNMVPVLQPIRNIILTSMVYHLMLACRISVIIILL